MNEILESLVPNVLDWNWGKLSLKLDHNLRLHKSEHNPHVHAKLHL